MRGERDDHTLQPTALVNQTYINLITSLGADVEDRSHFLCLAARKMRHILIDHARKRNAHRHGGSFTRVTLGDDVTAQAPTYDIIDFDRALTELESLHQDQARVIELRYMIGLTVDEVARELELSPRTVKNHTRFAKAWLRQHLE